MAVSGSSEQAWTMGSLLNWTAGYLAQKACESPHGRRNLLAHVLGASASISMACAMVSRQPTTSVSAIAS